MAQPCPRSAASLISQQGSTWGQSQCWAMRSEEGDEGTWSPETEGCWEMALRPPEGQSDPFWAEPPWILPAAPSPTSSGPSGLLGSAQWGLRPRVIVPVQNWGAVAVPQGKWHLPTYLFPSGVAGQGWGSRAVPLFPPYILVLNKEMLQGASTHKCVLCKSALFHPLAKPWGVSRDTKSHREVAVGHSS